MNGGKIVADDVDGGVICEQYCGVRRKHRRKIIDKNREKSRTEYRALRNTRGREARGRVRVGDTSDMARIGKIRTKPAEAERPRLESLDNRSSWLTVSKALEMSRKTTPTNFF